MTSDSIVVLLARVEDFQGALACRIEGDAAFDENRVRDAAFLADEAEQKVLRADVRVVEMPRLGHGELEPLFCARIIRQVGAGLEVVSAASDELFYSRSQFAGRDAERFDHAERDAGILAEKSEQNVLGPHVLVVQPCRFLSGEAEGPADAFSEVVSLHRLVRRRAWSRRAEAGGMNARSAATSAATSIPWSAKTASTPESRASVSMIDAAIALELTTESPPAESRSFHTAMDAMPPP